MPFLPFYALTSFSSTQGDHWTLIWIPPSILLVGQLVKNLPAMQETLVHSLGWENLLDIPWSRKELDMTEQHSLLSCNLETVSSS